MASPWLLESAQPLQGAADLARFTLIEAGDIRSRNFEILAWQRWFTTYQQGLLQPHAWPSEKGHRAPLPVLRNRAFLHRADGHRVDDRQAPRSAYIGQTAPFSLRIASSGISCDWGSKSDRKPCVNPSPTV